MMIPVKIPAMKGMKSKSGMTMQRIAELAGVSRGAVSAVLNNRWRELRLTEQTRDKIEAVLKKNRFQPHSAGKALAFRRSFVIGMVVEEINFSFLPEALQGVEDFTEQRGYGLLLMTTRRKADRVEQVLNFLLARNVDGIILGPGVKISRTMQTTLAGQNIPVVFLGHSEDKTRFACVDGFQIGYLGIRHLLDRGHRRVACWNMPDWIKEGIEQGVLESQEDIQITHWPFCTYQEILDRWSSAHPRPTALFINGDEMACKVLNRAVRQGINMPEELAIMGIDDIPAAAEAVIPLTTISQPKREQGLAVAQIVFDLIEGKPGKNIILKPKLVVRETT